MSGPWVRIPPPPPKIHTANYTSCQAVKTLDYKSENMGSNPILCEMYLVYGVLAELANCT